MTFLLTVLDVYDLSAQSFGCLWPFCSKFWMSLTFLLKVLDVYDLSAHSFGCLWPFCSKFWMSMTFLLKVLDVFNFSAQSFGCLWPLCSQFWIFMTFLLKIIDKTEKYTSKLLCFRTIFAKSFIWWKQEILLIKEVLENKNKNFFSEFFSNTWLICEIIFDWKLN